MFIIKRILEIISFHLYVQIINNHIYNVDKVSLKKWHM